MEIEKEKIERSLVCALIMVNIVGMWSFIDQTPLLRPLPLKNCEIPLVYNIFARLKIMFAA